MKTQNETESLVLEMETDAKIPNELNKAELKEIVPAAFVTKPHPKMSNRYQFINTEQVIDKLIEDGFKPFGADQLRYRDEKNPNNGFQFHEISFYHPNLVIMNEETGKIEEVFEVIVTNSHNGYSKFSLYCSFYRIISDSDMLCISNDLGGIITNNARQITDFNPNTLFNEITNHFLDMVKCIKKMKETSLTKIQQNRIAKKMAEIRHAKQEGKFGYDPKELLTPIHEEDKGKKDLWTTYNVVLEKLIKGYMFPKAEKNKKIEAPEEDNSKDEKIPRKLRAIKHFELALNLNKEVFETVKTC
jgi:hypothetical protein